MDINIGDRIILEMSTFEDRFLGLVADIRPDGSLKVFANLPDAVVDRMKTDPFALVRYAFDGRLMGFNTRVLNRVKTPDMLIELACPDRIFDAEERIEPRCSCSFPAFVMEEGKAVRAVVEDMSASCSRVRFLDGGLTDFPEELERQVRLTFHPFDMEGKGYSVGCSVSKAFMRNGVRYAVLRFNKDEPDARKRISGFIEAQVCCNIPRL